MNGVNLPDPSNISLERYLGVDTISASRSVQVDDLVVTAATGCEDGLLEP